MANQEQDAKPLIQYQEGSPWFWKIFGGAIMGLVSILLLAHITNLNSNLDRSFLDLRGDIKEARHQLDNHRERLTALEQGSYREKISSHEKMIAVLQASLDETRQKCAATEANNIALKDDLKALREWNKETSRQLQEVREKLAVELGKKKAEQP